MIGTLKLLLVAMLMPTVAVSSPALQKQEQSTEAQDSIKTLALSFYDNEHFRLAGYGGWQCKDWPLSKNLTREFAGVLCAYLDMNERLLKEPNPNQDKILPCGLLFIGTSEGVTNYQLGKLKTNGNRAEVDMNLFHSSSLGKGSWQDRLILQREKGLWKLDDIILNSDSDMPNSLTERVKQDIEIYKKAR